MTKYVFYDRLEAIVLARQYASKTEFRLENKALYSYARRHGWWPEMSKFMVKPEPKRKWTKEAIFEVARKYSVKVVFTETETGAASAARKMGILSEVCAHMKRRLLPNERVDGRECTKCGKFTEPDNLAVNSAHCKECHSKRTCEYAKKNRAWKASTVAKRRARIKQAIPPWVGEKELKEIERIYAEARLISDKTGIPHEVDHIYPLQGRNVCGLHVKENLQILTKEENRRKSAKVPK